MWSFAIVILSFCEFVRKAYCSEICNTFEAVTTTIWPWFLASLIFLNKLKGLDCKRCEISKAIQENSVILLKDVKNRYFYSIAVLKRRVIINTFDTAVMFCKIEQKSIEIILVFRLSLCWFVSDVCNL